MSEETLLNSYNFDNGYPMPVGNEENKDLERQIQEKELRVLVVKEEIAALDEHLKSMYEHKHNVCQQRDITTELLAAWRKDMQSEGLLYSMVEREKGRLRQEIDRLNVILEDLQTRMDISETYIAQKTEVLEGIRAHMNFSRQEMDEWMEISLRQANEMLALQHYMRTDEEKIKCYLSEIENLQLLVQAKQKESNEECVLTRITQLELDKAADTFRSLHAERKEVLQLWEHSIEQMQRRDQQMKELATLIQEAHVWRKETLERLMEAKNFTAKMQDENEQMVRRIDTATKKCGRAQEDLRLAEEKRLEFVDELDILRRRVAGTYNMLQATQAENKQLLNQIRDSMDRLSAVKRRNQYLGEQKAKATQEALSAEDTANVMDELFRLEEEYHDFLFKEITALGQYNEKVREQLNDTLSELKVVEVDHQGSLAMLRSLKSHIENLSNQSDYQRDQLASVENMEGLMGLKIARMEGMLDRDTTTELRIRIQKLEARLDRHCKERDIIVEVQRRTAHCVVMMRKYLNNNLPRWAKLEHDVLLLEHTQEVAFLELKRVSEKRKTMLVDYNVFKIDLKKLKDHFLATSHQVFALEKKKAELEHRIKERRVLVQQQKEQALFQLKLEEEERAKYAIMCNEANQKLVTTKNRFELMAATMARDESGEFQSVSSYAEKYARELDEARSEGEQMNQKLMKARLETKALANSLAIVKERHETIRESYFVVGESSDDMQQKKKLEDHAMAMLSKRIYQKKIIRDSKSDMKKMLETNNELIEKEAKLRDLVNDKKMEVSRLVLTLEAENSRMRSLEDECTDWVVSHRTEQETPYKTPEERDISVREMNELVSTVIKMIGETVELHPDIADRIFQMFTEAGMKVPPSVTEVINSRPVVVPTESAETQTEYRKGVAFKTTDRAGTRHGKLPPLKAPSQPSSDQQSSSQRPPSQQSPDRLAPDQRSPNMLSPDSLSLEIKSLSSHSSVEQTPDGKSPTPGSSKQPSAGSQRSYKRVMNQLRAIRPQPPPKLVVEGQGRRKSSGSRRRSSSHKRSYPRPFPRRPHRDH